MAFTLINNSGQMLKLVALIKSEWKQYIYNYSMIKDQISWKIDESI